MYIYICMYVSIINGSYLEIQGSVARIKGSFAEIKGILSKTLGDLAEMQGSFAHLFAARDEASSESYLACHPAEHVLSLALSHNAPDTPPAWNSQKSEIQSVLQCVAVWCSVLQCAAV